MEEEGDEEEVKKKKIVKTKPKLKPKPKLSADGTPIKRVVKKKAPTVGENGASTTTKKESDEDKKEPEEDKKKETKTEEAENETKEKSEETDASSSKKDTDDDSQDTKIGKTVSFSPSTEFIEGKETKKRQDKSEPIEAVIVKEIEPEKKHIVAVTTVFLNTPTENVKEESDDKDMSYVTEKPPEDDAKKVLNPEGDESTKEMNDRITSDNIKVEETSITKPEVDNEMQVDETNAEGNVGGASEPVYPLPPKNAEVVSPDLPPKDESLAATAKKRLGVPIMSAMKKMVEGPKNLMDTIKSKIESKSPTRKEKKEKGDKEEPPVKKPKDDTGSPPLPPRNKPDAGSPKLSLKNDGSPRTSRSDAFRQSIFSTNFFCDDPKRFSSLQPKKHIGPNGRIRESSLPPPPKPSMQDGRKSPKIPPKTYMWEELRRNKLKGGYPWTHLYKGSFDEAKWKEIMEHEYEYVDPRPELLKPEPIRPAGAKASPRSSPRVSPRATPEPEKPKAQRRFIRIRDTDQVIIPLHGSSDEEHNPDRYEDPELIGQEEIGLTPAKFRPTPSPSPSRRKAVEETKLSDKLRTTAGTLGSKIRKISLPDKSKLRLPDKPKFIADIQQIKLPETPKFLTEKPKFLTEKPKFLTEKPKFLTEKPKFLTEKPKFLTEKPKFLTEKPKFLTEKPKFLTERPKFLTEKPKFLTERPKFLTEKPKFLTEKPKFLTERPKFLKEGIKFPDRSKFKLPERPKINMPSIKLPRTRRVRPKRETSVKSEYGSEKNIFHTIKARTYPRFLNRRKKQGIKKSTPPPGQSKFDSESLPSTPRSKRNEQWTEVYKEKRVEEEAKVTSYTNGESFHERYSKREAKRASSSSVADSDREQVSSGSSTQRHRAGVIEEIDSDEFFVRVKGISREDVQVSKYLSSEIREAFRSPKNALASLDKDFDDEEPLAPHRSKKPKEYPRQDFNTFPLRPSRAKKDNGTMEKPPRRFRSNNKPGSLPSLNRDQEFDMEVEEAVALTKEAPPMAPKRRKSTKDLEPDDHWTTIEAQIVPDEGMAQEEMKVEYDEPPVAPVRKARSRGTSLADEDRTSRGAESLKSEMQIDDDLNDDFRMDDERDKEEKEPIDMKASLQITEITIEKNILEETPAYSNVSKSRPPRPPPPAKEAESRTLPRLKSKIMGHRHMQTIQTWKNQSVDFFFTYPRKAMKSMKKTPKRPVRNYSTIAGPIRPPRKHKVFREPVYVDADVEPIDSIPYIDDEEKLKASPSEEAIGGMKGRPLPPPPRPPLPAEDFEDMRETMITEELNMRNALASQEPFDEPLPAVPSEEIIVRQEDKMQSRPLPPPPRRKRGSSSSDRKRGSTPGPAPLNDLDGREEDEEPIDACMTIDISEPSTVLSVKHVEPSRIESEIVRSEAPASRHVETVEEAVEAPPRRITAEISQQTSLEIAEITVSVQTDPLPEGAIVEDTDDTSKSKPTDSDEEPTIEKYLEKYGSEIKMLGRPTPVPEVTKPLPQKQEQVTKGEIDTLESIEREIIPTKLTEAESDRNIDKSETKVIEKSMPIEKEEPKKEEPKKEEPKIEEPKKEESVVERVVERVVVVEREPPKSEVPSFPDRLHLTHLDVDNLNVSSLKASQILVSDLTGQSLQVTELTSRGGNLVVSGMEFPPNFIQNLASEITAKVEEKLPQKPPEPPQPIVIEVVQQPQKAPEVVQQQPTIQLPKRIPEVQPSVEVTKEAATSEETEATTEKAESDQASAPPKAETTHKPQKMTLGTAPPTVVVQTAAESVCQPSPEAGVLSTSDNIPTPRTTRNKKKSSESTRIVDDSEDELASAMEASPKPKISLTPQKSSPSTSQPSTSTAGPSKAQVAAALQQPIGTSGLTARQLLIELLKIWTNCVKEGFSACSNTVGSMFPEGQKRRDAQTAACVLFVIIIGLFALGFGTDNTVHYHHWDFMPPK